MVKFSSIVLALILCFFANQGKAVETLKLRSDLWCPYACEPGKKPGVLVEIAQKILEPLGYKIDYQLLNFARVVSDTRVGIYDGVIGAAKVDAPDFTFPKDSQVSVTFEFFNLKTSPWKYKGSLEDKKITIINGYNYDPSVNNFIAQKDPHFVVVSGEDAQEQMVRMLVGHRSDALYEAKAVFMETVSRMKLDANQFQSAGAPSQKPQQIYIAFSPKNKNSQKLAEEIDAGMKKLRRSGELKKIYSKYGL
jgi:polar amino acid transport system substrate-binding protein